MDALLKLNLGCGNQTASGWMNVDYSLGAKLAKLPLFSLLNMRIRFFNLNWNKNIFIYDLRKNFPWIDNSVDIIYSSHLLEHLSKEDGVRFIKECYRVLKKNGVIRIVVPDLHVIARRYIEGEIQADVFVEELRVLYNHPRDGFIKKRLAPFIRFPHKCMYDEKRLLDKMSDINFKVVGKNPFESDIIDIEQIELAERTKDAVIVEGHKI